jgi:catechol 2,3-dioxygenase-like lactoylglutathione lyase family enzyme
LNIRGIDHVGITVPGIEQATAFFVDAFDAIDTYDIIDAPIGGVWIKDGLGRQSRHDDPGQPCPSVGKRPNIELFNYSTAHQQPAASPSDMGYQHAAVFVDDIAAASRKLEAAEARILGGGPHDLPGAEAGRGVQVPVRAHAVRKHRRARHLFIGPGESLDDRTP